MKKREWKKELDILFGLIGDDREHWKKGDWHWTKSKNESIAYREMRARWFSCADRIISKAIAQERKQVVGEVAKVIWEIVSGPLYAHDVPWDVRENVRNTIYEKLAKLKRTK